MESEYILDKEIESWKRLRYRAVQGDVMTSLKAGRHPWPCLHAFGLSAAENISISLKNG